MDEIKYKIHSVTEDEVPVMAVVDGSKVEAKIKVLLVEAVSSDGSSGHTFKIRGGQVEDYPVGGDLMIRLIPDTEK